MVIEFDLIIVYTDTIIFIGWRAIFNKSQM